MNVGRVTAVMTDTVDLDGSAAFWTEALALKEVHRTDTYIYLEAVSEGGPHLAFQKVDEPRPGKNRLHLDVAVDDRDAFSAWVVERGGSEVTEVAEPGFPTWLVMTDPQGNEFCIYERQRRADDAGE